MASVPVAATRELPLTAPPSDVPSYREKFWVSGYDAAAGAGFSIWLETSPGDYGQWTENLQVVLPGRLLRSRTVTPRREGAHVGGQHAWGVCREPLAVWDYQARFEAEAFDIARVPGTPGRRTEVALDLRLTSTAPAQEVIKAADAALEESTFGTQYRQFFNAAGSVEVDGRRIAFDGPGFRARTTGPVAGGSFGGHAMISARFPSGRGALMLRQVRPDRSLLVNWAAMLDGDRAEVATIIDAPLHLTRVTPQNERFDVSLSSALGDWTVEVETVAPMLVVDPGYFIEAARSAEDLARVKDQAGFANNIACARFRLDGETTYGMTERSARTNLLDEE